MNLLLVGRKRWWLTPPSTAGYSTIPVAKWVRDGMALPATGGKPEEEGVAMQCEQTAADAMFVPAGWGHAVLNVEASVGVALEWGSPYQTSL